MTTDIKQTLANALGREAADLDDDTALMDLVAESFALVEAVITLQEDLKIRLVQEDLRDVKTVRDLIQVCVRRLP